MYNMRIESLDLTAAVIRLPERRIFIISVYIKGGDASVLNNIYNYLRKAITKVRQGSGTETLTAIINYREETRYPRGGYSGDYKSTIDLALASEILIDSIIKYIVYRTEYSLDYGIIKTNREDASYYPGRRLYIVEGRSAYIRGIKSGLYIDAEGQTVTVYKTIVDGGPNATPLDIYILEKPYPLGKTYRAKGTIARGYSQADLTTHNIRQDSRIGSSRKNLARSKDLRPTPNELLRGLKAAVRGRFCFSRLRRSAQDKQRLSRSIDNCRRFKTYYSLDCLREKRSGVTFKAEKIAIIYFVSKARKVDQKPFTIKGQTVEPKSKIKILGVLIDTRLKYKEHITRAASKGLEADRSTEYKGYDQRSGGRGLYCHGTIPILETSRKDIGRPLYTTKNQSSTQKYRSDPEV
ncbi:hypothetical protein N7527_009206 [Penicillium freii]|nr:hypothetical protein N7527_009206 [Penicillium freii]